MYIENPWVAYYIPKLFELFIHSAVLFTSPRRRARLLFSKTYTQVGFPLCISDCLPCAMGCYIAHCSKTLFSLEKKNKSQVAANPRQPTPANVVFILKKNAEKIMLFVIDVFA